MNGGSACWIDTAADIDATVLSHYAANLGVFIESGQSFFLDDHKHFLRLGFGSISADKIDDGIRRLAQATEEYYLYNWAD